MTTMKYFAALTFIMLMLIPLCVEGEWYEMQSFGMGNLYFPGSSGNDFGSFTRMPDSPYILFSYRGSIMTFEVDKARVRCGMTANHYFSSPVVLPAPESGWNLIYTADRRFGKLHIDTHGEFRDEVWLSKTYEMQPTSIAVPQKREAWFFSDKILRYNDITGKWTTYQYPRGWDPDNGFVKYFQTEDGNTLFIRSYGETIQRRQLMMIDLENGSIKSVNLDSSLLESITDIDQWNSRPGTYLFLTFRREIWTYEASSEKLELYMNGFDARAVSIMQDISGRYLYFIGKSGEETQPGADFYILDLNSKSIEHHILPLEKGGQLFVTEQAAPIFDRERSRIIAFLGGIFVNNELVDISI